MSDRSTDQRELSGGGRNANSLVVESLEIGRSLADHGRAKFRAQGSCMYPCVQPGDTLHIESRPIEGVKVGDIAVVRHNGCLFGHRTIAKGEDKDGHYIVTRPDRSNHGSDGPTHEENILGIVTKIERRGKQASTKPIPLKGYAKARISLWEWWNWDARLRMSKRLERVQRLRIYQNIASPCLKALHPHLRYEVRTPLKPGQSHDLYRVFPPNQFDVNQPLQQGKPLMEWTLALYLDAMRTPAGWATLVRRPEDCPRGKGWHIEGLWVRIRYRGAGLEDTISQQAEKILARSGQGFTKTQHEHISVASQVADAAAADGLALPKTYCQKVDWMKQQPTMEIQDFPLWAKLKECRAVLSFDLEITARCSHNCRHCYINLPAGDQEARSRELTLPEISAIADQAVALGAMWVLISGGEPLLREDFPKIYLALKRKGLLVSVFTNATLLRDEYIELFRKYPPRDIEITVYGTTAETYERVTGRPGSFAAFMNGLNRLLENGIKVRLKAMAIRSNFHELPAIAAFCRAHTKDYFRFDPQLHLRFDRDGGRNAEIKAERLTPEEIVALEMADEERFSVLQKGCNKLINEEFTHIGCDHLFHCGAGNGSFNVSYDGKFRLCSSLWAPETMYDLRQGTLREAWEQLVPKVRDMRSQRREFLERCRRCSIVNLCLWCPAHSYLETGEMDRPIDYFCQVAHARAAAITS